MDEVEQLISYLYTFDARAAATRLIEIGAAAVEPLVAVINGTREAPDVWRLKKAADVPAPLITCLELMPQIDSAAAKERAAYVLGDIGDTRAVEPLITAYPHESERHIRLAILRALGKIGDARAVDTLIAALDVPPWTPEYTIVISDLDRIGGERIVEPLIHFLHRPRYSYGCAARAIHALVRRRNDPRVLDAIIDSLRLDAEFVTLDAAFSALEDIGDRRGVKALLNLINQMIDQPAECWDDRDDNLSETEQGVIYHVLRTEFQRAVAVIRRVGDADASAVLDRTLDSAPAYIQALAT
ncbi:MAG TPA: HEAT repeat domain-containing protein [Phototrophicaceae bacterium]|nr:HEAT repeat domain-containing protein [Phototrophicaceae bacterium]